MSRFWQSVWHGLRLIRPVQATTALADAWLMLSLGGPPVDPVGDVWPLGVAMLLTAAAVVGLHIHAVVMNDLLDVRRDRLWTPGRPLASGQWPLRRALVLWVFSLLLALGAAMLLGRASLGLALLAAALALFYNLLGKHVPGAGLLTLGLFRSVLMILASPQATFLWPLWLMLTHNLAYLGLVNRLEGKRPRLTMNQIWTLCIGWAVMSFLILWVMRWRQAAVAAVFPGPVMLGPLLAALVFAVLVWRLVPRSDQPLRRRRASSQALLRLSSIWTPVYGVLWLAGLGHGFWMIPIVLLGMMAWGFQRLMAFGEEISASPPQIRLP